MFSFYLSSAGASIVVNTPVNNQSMFEEVFAYNFSDQPISGYKQFATIELAQDKKDDSWSLSIDGEQIYDNQNANGLAIMLSREVIRLFADQHKQHVALHAGAVVKNGISVVIPGNSGNGKTSLCAWLTKQGYEYFGDELVLFNNSKAQMEVCYRPFNVKTRGYDAIKSLACDPDEALANITDGGVHFISPERVGGTVYSDRKATAGLFLFPEFKKGSTLEVDILTPAQAVMSLTKSFINARNLKGMGFAELANLSKFIPAIKFLYGDYKQLDGFLDNVTQLILDNQLQQSTLLSLADSLVANQATPQGGKSRTSEAQATDETKIIPTPVTDDHKNKKLTVAMATYDDYDGVYFTVQSLRLFHAEVCDEIEILILDNNPSGKCTKDLKAITNFSKNIRYVPVMHRKGTAVRDLIFDEANSDYVLCLDCHVMIEQGAVKRLIDYYQENPQSIDLIQGPMLNDSLTGHSTHFKDEWNKGMYGTWGADKRGEDNNSEPFDIPMQGLGLFSCKKSSWPGFNENFRGFGGEEGYIHEKFRQQGGRSLCLPFLRWLHRFARPMGVPYKVDWKDRIMNYYIGFDELGLPTEPITEHFSELLSEDTVQSCIKRFEVEFDRKPN